MKKLLIVLLAVVSINCFGQGFGWGWQYGFLHGKAKKAPTITSQPQSVNINQGSNTSFSVTATGTGLSYQWQYLNGSIWTDLTNAGVYSGVTTSTMTITASPTTINEYSYRCIVTGSKLPAVTSNTALLVVKDPNAVNYWTATGISDTTQKKAINQLVIDLKTINTTSPDFVNFNSLAASKRKAIYPFVGTTTAINKYNLLSPFDADSSYRGVFTGTPTMTSKGVKFLSGKWMDTKANANTILANAHHEIDCYLNTDTIANSAAYTIDMGAFQSASAWLMLNSMSDKSAVNIAQEYEGDQVIQGAVYWSNGFTQLNRKSSSIGGWSYINNLSTVFTNGTAIGGAMPNANIFIGTASGLTSRPGIRRFTFASFGDSISTAANKLYLKAIEDYNYRLGRQPLFNLTWEGHSFVAGFSSAYINYPTISQLNKADSSMVGRTNNGSVGGSTITSMAARFPTTVTPFYLSPLKTPWNNILVLWIGANDIDNNVTGTTAWSNLKTAIQTPLNLGYKVILITMTPNNYTGGLVPDSSTVNQRRLVFNDSIRNSGYIKHCYFFDTDLYSQTLNPSNTIYYNTDKLHPKQALFNVLATPLAAKIVQVSKLP